MPVCLFSQLITSVWESKRGRVSHLNDELMKLVSKLVVWQVVLNQQQKSHPLSSHLLSLSLVKKSGNERLSCGDVLMNLEWISEEGTEWGRQREREKISNEKERKGEDSLEPCEWNQIELK